MKMVFCLHKLECLIERWQSRKQTIEISQAKSEPKRAKKPAKGRSTKIRVNNGDNSNYRNNSKVQQPPPISHQAQQEQKQQKPNKEINISPPIKSAATATPLEVKAEKKPIENDGLIGAGDDQRPDGARAEEGSIGGGGGGGDSQALAHLEAHASSNRVEPDECDPTIATVTNEPPTAMIIKHPLQTPNINFIHVLSVLVLLIGIVSHCELTQPVQLTIASPTTATTTAITNRGSPSTPAASSSSLQAARRIGELHLSNLIHQLAGAASTRSRWVQIPGPPSSIRDPPDRQRQTYLSRAVSRLRNQIGARNTIRVHNAFRDFAWRLLSRLNMPTPVIYELRRQHLYSPEDDSMNDSFFNKNTSRTVRTKRQLFKSWPASQGQERRWIQGEGGSLLWPWAREDDDDESDSLGARLRLRLEDLANLPRRSLFGRVIRRPTLFPFKRKEETGDSKHEKGTGGGRRASRRRRKKDEDRQMISINGKQYYLNDEGELKELNEKSEQ